MRRALLALLVFLGVGACGRRSVGESCDQVLRAFCERASACLGGTAADTEACVSAGVPECCGKAGTCQSDVRDAAAVDRCVQETHEVSCVAWQAWARAPDTSAPPLPGVCYGVARP
jgi:hypothetical protein